MHNASVIIRYALCTTRPPRQACGTNKTWVMFNKYEEGEEHAGKVKHLQVRLRYRGGVRRVASAAVR